MRDPEAQTTSAVPIGEPDRTPPGLERQAELETQCHTNIAAGRAPYEHVRISSLGEVEWIFQQHRWSGEFDLPSGHLRPNLSGADLRAVNLYGVHLRETHLDRANLWWANLSGADLREAHLPGAGLHGADLSGANLGGANLSRADFVWAMLNNVDCWRATLSESNLSWSSLSGADLRQATLSGASLREANLTGADLTRALFTAETTLDGVKLDTQTRILGVRWNGVALDEIAWPRQLGDEMAISKVATRRDRLTAYRDAQRAYHGLYVALREQGLTELSSRYRHAEQELRRKELLSRGNILGWLFYSLLRIVAGYGEKPERALLVYIAMIAVYTSLCWMATNLITTGSRPLTWSEALVLSVSSFHGRGFFPQTIALGDPLAMIAASEAVIGLFIELIFIATFSRRFLES